MKRSAFVLLLGASIVSLLSIPAKAQVASSPAGDTNCSADHFHVNDLVSYAEVREQRLANAPTNSISPGSNGSIKVHGWNNPDVLVRACIQSAAPSESEARALASQVTIANGPGLIEPTGPSRGDRQYWGVSYEVWAPSVSNLSLQAHNGSISVDAIRGQIRFHTSNGSVRLNEVGGDVDGSTTNGSVTVDLVGTGWTGTGLRVHTTNGSVRLNLPPNFSAHVQASTVNGRVHSDFPMTVSGDIGKNMSFQLGTGGPTIEARTTNGSVTIGRRG